MRSTLHSPTLLCHAAYAFCAVDGALSNPDGSGSSGFDDDATASGSGRPWPELPFWPVFLPQVFMFILVLALLRGYPQLRNGFRNMKETFICCLSAATPMSDTTSDLLVAYSFFMVGDYWWFSFSAINILVAGLAAVAAVNGWGGLKRKVRLPGDSDAPQSQPVSAEQANHDGLDLAQRMAGGTRLGDPMRGDEGLRAPSLPEEEPRNGEQLTGGDAIAPTVAAAGMDVHTPRYPYPRRPPRSHTVDVPKAAAKGELLAPSWLPESVRVKSTLAFWGLAPVVEALALVTCLIQVNEEQKSYPFAEEDAARTKVVELIAETGPQVVLQTFVAVSYGLLEPATPLFSKTFMFSMFVSCVTAAWAFASQQKAAGSFLLELVFVYIWRLGEVVSRAFSLALLGCALGGAGFMMLALCAEGLVFLGCSLVAKRYIHGTRYTTLVLSTVLSEFDNSQDTPKIVVITAPIWLSLNSLFFLGATPNAMSDMDVNGNVWIAVRYYLVRALVLVCYNYVFWNVVHAPNNYGDKFLPVPEFCDWDAPSPPCHSCLDRELAFQLCTHGTVVMYLGLLASITWANLCGRGEAKPQRDTFVFSDGALSRWKPGDTWCMENTYVQLADEGGRVGRVHSLHRDRSGSQIKFVSVMWQSGTKKKPRFQNRIHMRSLVHVPMAKVSQRVVQACSIQAYEAWIASTQVDIAKGHALVESELEDGWQPVIDPVSGKTYYENKELGATTWDPPCKANVQSETAQALPPPPVPEVPSTGTS
jgi:hypothetical protein